MSEEAESEAYRNFLRGLRLRYFSPQEVIRYGSAVRNGEQNSLPPEELWDNLVPCLNLMDTLRHYIKRPIRLTSIYRSPDFNRKGVGGSRRSYHMQNCAIDFQVDGMTPNAAFNQLLKMRKAGAFIGGLGQYPTFTHVDTRDKIATW